MAENKKEEIEKETETEEASKLLKEQLTQAPASPSKANAEEESKDQNADLKEALQQEPTPVAVQIPEEKGSYNPPKVEKKKYVYTTLEDVLKDQPFDTYTEGLRAQYNKDIRKGRWLTLGLNIALFLFAVLTLVFAFVGMRLGQDEQGTPVWTTAMIWTSLGIAVVLLVLSLVFSSNYRKKNNGIGYKYEKDFTAAYLQYIYLDVAKMSGMEFCIDAEAKDEDAINTHYWATINYISSRLRVVGLYDGIEYTDTEILMSCPRYSSFVKDIEDYFASQTPSPVDATKEEEKVEENKKSAPVSLENPDPTDSLKKTADKEEEKNKRDPSLGAYGHLITYALKATTNDRIIITKTISDSYPPTNVRGFKRLEELSKTLGNDITVYASSEAFASKILTAPIIEALSAIKTDSAVLDFFFAFNNHGSYFLLNTPEELINVPTNWKADYDKYAEFAKDIDQVLKVFSGLKSIQEKEAN